MVTRYNDTEQPIQTVYNRLYRRPGCITENRNGDVIVSDIDRVIVTNHGVVTERGGRHRFSYTGPPSGSGLIPLGICTDIMSHILVRDVYTNSYRLLTMIVTFCH
ncbi:uncharacterized protein LOC134262041 [Saccostrea cucullata]|uniref:uncharacterized protein LOC134262041 n=1 Tax=Saccostrea cuccullata TaxID=36930 RepID=UPI002ED4CE39